MIKRSDVITVNLSASEMRLIRSMGKAAEIGGASQIRGDADRAASLGVDQVVGQIGTYVGCKYFLGDIKDYRVSRYYANKAPTVGDGGSDITGSNIDLKASLVRNPSKDLLTYNLPVRLREMHVGWVYVLVLVEALQEKSAKAHLVGWASTAMLPDEPDAQGVFAGAHTIRAKDLNPLPPLRRWF